MADIDRRELYKQFQDAFPIESLKEMTLEKYTNLNRDDSFCYWLESRTYTLGSFWGGSSFKFGIYKYAKPPKTPDRYAVFDNNYAWYNKYKKNTPQEAFEVVKEAIVSIAEHARKGELESIDKIDVLGEAYKWKIAFLYSNESLIPIYKREMLNIISAELGMNEPKKKSVPYIQRFLLLKKGDNDLYEYYDELLSILNRNNAQNTFATLKFSTGLSHNNDNLYPIWLHIFTGAISAISQTLLSASLTILPSIEMIDVINASFCTISPIVNNVFIVVFSSKDGNI